MRLFVTTLVIMALIGLAAACMNKGATTGGQEMPDIVSYNFHIRPILSDKCFACHGPDVAMQKAGLRLDIPDSAYAPLHETKGAFAIVPGKPDQSELMKRISSTDPAYQMPTPESHLSLLNDHEIALFRKWIKQGAKYEKHWAFIPPEKLPLPVVKRKDWPRNEIDHFILKKMESKNFGPNPEADKERLLKRVALDLTGLPPSLEMMDRFLADNTEGAYEKIVDELLSDKAYGEKMAVHWLDIARYADSYGYQDDNIRTQWPYRDWVIHAFNANIPYDRFIVLQLAGDMLPDASKENILATAFLRNHKYTEEGGVIEEEYRVEYLVDKTKTYGKGVLGLTIECAQCHDHKYDPFSQEDYFRLYAFFNNTYELGYEGDVSVSKPAKNPMLSLTKQEIDDLYAYINYQDTVRLTVSVMGERDTLRKTYVLNRGLYDSPGKEVEATALNAVMPFDTTKYEKNRKGLAEWTVDRNNPLTARVFVNQLWQEIFGVGLLKTSGDFGMQGELPTHPELLDWLAVDFMDHQWDIKYILKKIVSSAVYRQSAVVDREKFERDPDNLYYSRAPRNRLKAEFVRDLVLSSSGLLVKKLGGPSVKPYQPSGLWEASTSGRGVLANYIQDHGESLYRRGLYTFIKLTLPPPSMIMFDASNRDQCEVNRLKTNTPLQALIMMNDPTVMEAARVLAEKLVRENNDARSNLEKAFRLIVLRKPKKEEADKIMDYYNEQLALFTAGKLSDKKTLQAGEYAHIPDIDTKTAAAMMKTISLLYNLEETLSKS
ncbi:MAG TPA: PSD1 and planctomycete cytochrome C domain-containing protein [Flavitalea sp.]|nr:PSD1 and planctomycete cytochrome C domain-containing protein [Flavitalea sp.]